MRLVFINIIALIIAVTSLHVTVASQLVFHAENDDAISSLPYLDLDPIRNPNNKHSTEIETVPRHSFNLAKFAGISVIKIVSYLYYLPIYSLHRAKSYFLLI